MSSFVSLAFDRGKVFLFSFLLLFSTLKLSIYNRFRVNRILVFLRGIRIDRFWKLFDDLEIIFKIFQYFTYDYQRIVERFCHFVVLKIIIFQSLSRFFGSVPRLFVPDKSSKFEFQAVIPTLFSRLFS